MNKKSPIGTRVRVTELFERQYGVGVGDNSVEWLPRRVGPMEGLYIGFRYKDKGYHKTDERLHTEWVKTGTTLCAAVVFAPRENPKMVPYESMKEIL